jgi:hypothetical protein
MRFMPDKTPIDAGPTYEVHINDVGTAEEWQKLPSVACNSNGDIVISWCWGGIWSQNKISYKKWGFDTTMYPANTISGSEVSVVAAESGAYRPQVGLDDNDNLFIGWYSSAVGYNVRGALYTYSTAALLIAPFNVNIVNPNTETYPQLDITPNSDIVISWQKKIAVNDWDIIVRRGQIVAGPAIVWSPEIQVNTYTNSDQVKPSCAIDPNGNFVVAWQTWEQNAGQKWDVFHRRYDNAFPNPNPLDAVEVQVNSDTQNQQTEPDIDMDANGYYLIAWQSNSLLDGDMAWGIRGAEFKNDGTFKQSEFQVNNDTLKDQTYPATAVLRILNGVTPTTKTFYVVAWMGNQSCTVDDIYFKLYDKENSNAITLEDFSAIAEHDKVVLNWKTGTEIDNLGYFLVRSVDPENGYELVNKKIIPSNSIGTSGSEYTYNDVDVFPGTIYYYWLVTFDINGGYTIYGPVDVITYITAR